MFNAGTLAMPNLRGWNPNQTPSSVTLSNGRATATLASGIIESKTIRAVRGVSSGTMEWWITIDAVAAGIGFGVVGAAANGLKDVEDSESTILGGIGDISTFPSAGWYNRFGVAGNMLYSQVWSGGASSGAGPDNIEVGQTVKFTMDADSKTITISQVTGAGQHFRTFDAPDLGPWYPAICLVGNTGGQPQATISYTNPDL